MSFTRWFRVANWALAVAPFRSAVRKTPRRKPARPTLRLELLENRTLLAAGPTQPAPPVGPGEGSPAPPAHTGQPAQGGHETAPAQATSQADKGTGDRPQTVPNQQASPEDGVQQGDGSNGHKAQSGAVPGDDGVVRRAAAGENSPGRGTGSGDRSERPAGANATTGTASGEPTETSQATGTTSIVAPVGEGGLSADASSPDRASAFTDIELAVLLNGAGAAAVPDAGPHGAAFPGTNLQAGNLDQALVSHLRLGETSEASAVSQFLDEDGAFLELWDADQLLFPDSLPRMDEMLFPGGLPRRDDMPVPSRPPRRNDLPFPDEAANLGGAVPKGERPVEVPLFPVEVPLFPSSVSHAAESAPALPAGQENVATVAPMAGPGANSPDRSQLEAAPTANQSPQGQDPLRPYQIALGLLPVLAAFGFTPVTLREQVVAGRRLWEKWRNRRRHHRG